jgi:hypothetical protein
VERTSTEYNALLSASSADFTAIGVYCNSDVHMFIRFCGALCVSVAMINILLSVCKFCNAKDTKRELGFLSKSFFAYSSRYQRDLINMHTQRE